MDHLHKVARAALANPVTAGLAIHLGADGLENTLYIRPGFGRTAGHHAGAFQRAFLAAGHAGTDIAQAF
ncbi:hypothetical protein SDC9_180798 [bioreactor metagenome]|uniref:Uncharacterized protein n=1 Tax=bioreactor metagenome TaxID=1076179 RepID=A0A645HBY3_9ZZZZ